MCFLENSGNTRCLLSPKLSDSETPVKYYIQLTGFFYHYSQMFQKTAKSKKTLVEIRKNSRHHMNSETGRK